jgi:photoactive yellow protein
MERFEFQGTDISGVIDRLPDSERNRLPFGVVKMDTNGKILSYNMAEAEISGVKPSDVIGKNFFLDVAVCTQRPEFYGRFRDAMDNDKVLNLIFDYEFQNALYAPVHEAVKVRVHMFSSYELGGIKIVWLMVKRVGGAVKRPAVADVAAQAAVQMGVPTLGQGALVSPMPPMPPAFIPGGLMHAVQAPAWSPQPQQPYQQHPQSQPPVLQGAYAMPPAFAPQLAPIMMQPPAPQQRPQPQRPAREETNGSDILIHFDDV